MIAIVAIAIININNLEKNNNSEGNNSTITDNSNNDEVTTNQNTVEQSETIDNIEGTFIYNDSVKYEFDGNGNGAMYDSENEFEYTYSIKNGKLELNFKLDALHDATYDFILDGDTLKLIGGEGTTGGEYNLKKEN